MSATFHISLPVTDPERSAEFFSLLGGVVRHREGAYTNVDLFGTQLTLTRGQPIVSSASGFHFGLNMDRSSFEAAMECLKTSGLVPSTSAPVVVDAGTPLARTKLYLRCPAGYVIELKTTA